MAEMKIVNMAGAEVGTIALADSVFACEINGAVLHAAVKSYLGNQRQGTQSTLTRTEVSGGGKKPWRQKGTGRARQGSTRSPQWTHGGIALGPKPRSYRTDMNKKTKRVALFSALSDKAANGNLIVKKENEDSVQTFEVEGKCLLTVLASAFDARYMTVSGIVDAYNKEVEIWSADKIDVDETKLGLKGSPTKVFQSFPKAMKAPGEVHEVSEEEAVEIIVNKLKEKHII